MEINFDGIIGPTHNYSGLSYGNTASMEFGMAVSNPKRAALQGLEKMRTLHKLGIQQGVLPPQERPFIPMLHALGFYGTDEEILQKAWKADPKLLMACCSAAPMWAANSATISPSADSLDGRVHITPANLLTKFHRSFEAAMTGRVLYQIFNHPAHFAHHPPLPFHPDFADEGAANHTRFCSDFDKPGVQLFVYGRAMESPLVPKIFPARQTKETSQAIARIHRLDPQRVVFARQNPEAIDAGVFHNDVISVGHQTLFFYHEKAFFNTSETVSILKKAIEKYCHSQLIAIEVKDSEVSLNEAVKTYLFNSQIVTLPDQTMALIAPEECRNSPSTSIFLQTLLENKGQPIKQVLFQNIRESMQNGGGPACLRLRVALTPQEFRTVHAPVIFTDALDSQLVKWVEKHYRDRLTPQDLFDPSLLIEVRQALDELSNLLQLGPIYPFQRMGPGPALPEKRR